MNYSLWWITECVTVGKNEATKCSYMNFNMQKKTKQVMSGQHALRCLFDWYLKFVLHPFEQLVCYSSFAYFLFLITQNVMSCWEHLLHSIQLVFFLNKDFVKVAIQGGHIIKSQWSTVQMFQDPSNSSKNTFFVQRIFNNAWEVGTFSMTQICTLIQC